jgi:chromate reductase
MADSITIFGIAGSIRGNSFNRAVLRSARILVPDGTELDVFDDLAEVPPFNEDNEQSPPHVVSDMKARIRRADAVLFVTPEYNYSVPGVLKNAIDWASRPYGDSAWEGKPTAIMSASPGFIGGVRAQHHLRQSLVFLDMHPLNRPEVIITNAGAHFDHDGTLIDPASRESIRRLLSSLVTWTRRLQGVPAAA